MLVTETYMTIFSSGDLGKAAVMSVLLIPPAILAFLFNRKNMANISNKSEGTKALGNFSYNLDVTLIEYFQDLHTILQLLSLSFNYILGL